MKKLLLLSTLTAVALHGGSITFQDAPARGFQDWRANCGEGRDLPKAA